MNKDIPLNQNGEIRSIFGTTLNISSTSGTYEKQADLLCYLNDNMVEPTEHTKGIAAIFDIEFVDTQETHGWIRLALTE